MAAVSDENRLGPILIRLLADAQDRMKDNGIEPALVHLSPGNTVAWDNCCDGQLWVRVVSLLPMPQGSQPCDVHALQVRVGLGTLRCVTAIDDDGKFPTAQEMVADALALSLDGQILLQAIRCFDFGPHVGPKTIVLEQGLPLGNDGQCGGWEWTLTFQMLTAPCES